MNEIEADELIEALVKKSQSQDRDGCCSHPNWRGHLCLFHQGYEDGADAVLRAIGAIS